MRLTGLEGRQRHISGMLRTGFWVLLLSSILLAPPGLAQEVATDDAEGQVNEVAVTPGARDGEIDARITSILEATGWFSDIQVAVDDGIVFLDGIADSDEHREWARSLALKTEDVVAVVNRFEVAQEADWSMAPAFEAMASVARRTVASLPLIVLAIIVLPLTWWASSLAAQALRRLLLGGVASPFLRAVIARTLALPIFLFGLYVVLQVAGLTQIAFSVIGGAGVLGIVVGFAFRDIAENFLASLLLSIRQPFRAGDLIEVDGNLGSVRSMNTRSTVLISPEGNHIQIPNATVFKSVITNFTASPEGRDQFTVGIGYDAAISDAQGIVADVLAHHDAVLKTPEPMVLVDALGSSTVNLTVYYWVDVRAHSLIKVKSSVLRLVKKALTDGGISMPDDAREIIFPEGVPLIRDGETPRRPVPVLSSPRESGAEVTRGEAELSNELDEVAERAARADLPEDDGSLLE